MELYNAQNLRALAFDTINQNGLGSEMDRYIYSQQSGEGLGSILGGLFKKALPLIGTAIKGAVKIAKPHAIAAGKEHITAGAKRGAEELANIGTQKLSKKVIHRAHKKQRKWQGL